MASSRVRPLALLSLLFSSAPALADSGIVNINADAGISAPFTGRYGSTIDNDLGAAQAYGGDLTLGVDWQLFAPLSLEVIGGAGFQVIPPITNAFNGDPEEYTAIPHFSAGGGPRVRLFDKPDGGNLWASAHAAYHFFDGHQFGIDAGVGYQMRAFKRFSLGPFLRGALLFDSSGEGRHTTLATLGLSASFDLIPYDRTPKKPLDTDEDGVPDSRDAAPTIPEDKDNFEDEDGAPEPDNDNDGLRDTLDDCPNESGPADNKGCPKPPVLDRDGDGINDVVDAAPDDPEDKDGFEDTDGAPEPDNDKDGVLDTADQCPIEAGVPEERGCPVKDADGDGVADRADNCVTEAGPKDNQGCPVANKQLVIVTREALKILESVYFDTGKATIQSRSNRLLNQVAGILKEKSWVKQVRIEGHTDDVGDAAKNQKLSEARANAVRDYLIKQGVEADRLLAVGFGEDKPVSPNATAKGRGENRRVEFNIVQAD